MNDQMDRRLSAALRAHASGVGLGSGRRGPAHAKPSPSAWRVLVLAVLLGALAGALAGVISIW
ncbi:MAG: hypothetical protein JO272_07735 [Pseudonocardiales bacterium]|nr:hypothetical protein [Pseudonocardiales bacterium]